MEGLVNHPTFKPVVFNTGRGILGWIAAFSASNEDRFVEVGLRAGDFLLSSQDETGCFSRNCYQNIPRVYNVRCSWAQ